MAAKMAKGKYLLILSMDAVSDADVDQFLTMPCFSRLCSSGTLVRQVSSVFVSNTYPAHTSIVTGCHPKRHGVKENTIPSPGNMNPDWYWHAKHIKTPTIYTQAGKYGYTAASVMWPVTARAEIKYNIPEILANRWWKNQVAVSLSNGSPFLQLRAALKYGRGLQGSLQPRLDDFSCAAMCDIIKRKKPNLAMIHFTDIDTHKHKYGIHSNQVSDALERTDKRLGMLFSALSEAGIEEQCSIILLGDHGMLDVEKSVNFNKEFEKKGLLKLDKKGRITSWRAWLKCCGGTAFLYLKDKNDIWAAGTARECIREAMSAAGTASGCIQENISTTGTARDCIREAMSTTGAGSAFTKEAMSTTGAGKGVRRFLDGDELELSGLGSDCPFGVEAEAGYEFNEFGSSHMANHGYSMKQEGYETFYAAAGNVINKGIVLSGGSILDIAPLALKLLDLPGWEMDGILKEGMLT